MEDEKIMRLALDEARKAGARGEVPVGAVVTDLNGEVVVACGNESIARKDPTAHAEIVALRAACERAGAQRIPGYSLYVTLEPCAMCAGAVSFARIARLIYGAPDPKGGAVGGALRFFTQPTCHHRPTHIRGGLLATECGEVLRAFFKARR